MQDDKEIRRQKKAKVDAEVAAFTCLIVYFVINQHAATQESQESEANSSSFNHLDPRFSEATQVS